MPSRSSHTWSGGARQERLSRTGRKFAQIDHTSRDRIGVYATAREFGEHEWTATLTGLAERGLVQLNGTLTDAGRETKQAIEDRTDDLAATGYLSLDDGEVEELVQALRPITAAVVAAGEIPRQSPMGLDLDESLR